MWRWRPEIDRGFGERMGKGRGSIPCPRYLVTCSPSPKKSGVECGVKCGETAKHKAARQQHPHCRPDPRPRDGRHVVTTRDDEKQMRTWKNMWEQGLLGYVRPDGQVLCYCARPIEVGRVGIPSWGKVWGDIR